MDTSVDRPAIVKLAEEVPDPRLDRCKKHPMVSIIFVALISALCGADDWVEIQTVGESLESWIKRYVPLPNGIPSHDTFGRVFGLIRTQVFQEFLFKWADLVRNRVKGEIVSLDGKTLRGTADKGVGIAGIHLLNAWSVDNGICIGQLEVGDKTNEIKATPELINLLDLKECIITADALNTQKEIAATAIKAGADYVLPVKDNHKDLREEIALLFKDAHDCKFIGVDADQYETIEKGHGRLEKRSYYVMDAANLSVRGSWQGLESIGMVVRRRGGGVKPSTEVAYYMMSIELNARLFERCARGHWQVENSLHWSLDVIFREDASRYRNRTGAQNLGIIRKMALGMLRRDTSLKRGASSKRLKALSSAGYRERVLNDYL